MKNLCSLVALFTLFSFSSVQAQCTKGNCKTGKGTYLYPSGAKYVGDFKDGKINGEGMLIFSNGNRYVGQWENQFRQGKGKMTFANGDVYKGNFNQSKFHGNGTMEFKKGDKYTGQWGNDLQNGKGTYHYKSGNKYEGQFKNGKLHGQGTMSYKDGNKYTGHWENNYKDGQGTFFKADGSEIAGLWLNGKYVEEGSAMDEVAATEKITTDNSNTIPKDELPDCTRGDCPDGIGVYAYGDGSKWVGEFINGVPNGEGTCYYANSDKYVGNWKRHAPHGEGIMYYANDRVVGAIWEYGNPIQELEASNDMIAKEKIKVVEDDDVKIWAVVVGVARYVHMPVLKYTDDDAYHIYAFLKSPEGGALPDEQIRVLIDDDANRANIIRTMRQVFLQADENDVIVFYYSGHGLPGSFLPVDFDGFNNKLQHQDIKDVFGETKAKHKLVLADACHSGSLLTMRAGSNTAVEATLKKYYDAFENSQGGTALLLSSKGDEYSLEDKGLRQGIFSHYLIRGLKGEADKNKNKIVTITELFDFVHSKVRVYTGNAQTPTMTGEFDPDMPVAVSRR